VGTKTRIYFMHPETETEQNEWIQHIQVIIDSIRRGPTSKETRLSTELDNGQAISIHNEQRGIDRRDIRQRIIDGKKQIAFLEIEDSKVAEFWQVWSDSIPSAEKVEDGSVTFEVAISGDMDKMTWKASGTQHLFIQKMVDFFWNVGAPEVEIDRLNELGCLVNPNSIGSWIDMSSKGAMDGGWFFPVQLPIKLALESADSGQPSSKVLQWVQSNNIEPCISIGRDMGAAPPRQTEIRFEITGSKEFQGKLKKATTAYREFGFPAIPEEALEILDQSKPTDKLFMSVITTSEGFVRLGLFSTAVLHRQMIESLCNLSGGNVEHLLKFEKALGVDRPRYVEYQYLMENYGYGVYKEGFDIVFHYMVGEESFR